MANRTPFCTYNYNIKKRKNQEKIAIIIILFLKIFKYLFQTWTEPRTKGHFVICFLAFLLKSTLEFKLKRAHLPTLPQQIREALNSINFAEVKIKQKKFFIKIKFNILGNKILRLSYIKPPPNVIPTTELSL